MKSAAIVVHVLCNCGSPIAGALVRVVLQLEHGTIQVTGETDDNGLFIRGIGLFNLAIGESIGFYHGSVLACRRRTTFRWRPNSDSRIVPPGNTPVYQEFFDIVDVAAIPETLPAPADLDRILRADLGGPFDRRDMWVVGQDVGVACHANCANHARAEHAVDTYDAVTRRYRVRVSTNTEQRLRELNQPPPPPQRVFEYEVQNTGDQTIADFRICFTLGGLARLDLIVLNDESDPIKVPDGWSFRFEDSCLVFEADETSGIPPGGSGRFWFKTEHAPMGIAVANVSYRTETGHEYGPYPAELPGTIGVAAAPPEEPADGTVLLTGDIDDGIVAELLHMLRKRGFDPLKVDAGRLTTIITGKRTGRREDRARGTSAYRFGADDVPEDEPSG